MADAYINDILKAWAHTQTGTAPSGGLTLNDLLASLENDTAIVIGSEFQFKNSTTGNVRRMYLDVDDSIADEPVP